MCSVQPHAVGAGGGGGGGPALRGGRRAGLLPAPARPVLQHVPQPAVPRAQQPVAAAAHRPHTQVCVLFTLIHGIYDNIIKYLVFDFFIYFK